MNDTLFVLIVALLGVNLIFLILLLIKRPLDNTPVLREELRAARMESNGEQANMRRDIAAQLDGLGRHSLETMSKISEMTSNSLENMRITLDRRLEGIRAENEKSMNEIRQTVDKNLSDTVSAGLDNSFKSVSTQLEQVYKSMGEMRSMAADISGLKNVLSNVKNRGTWGEVQLGAIMEDIFLPTQYEAQFALGEGRERVDYAVKLPGQGAGSVYLPIDSKFPLDKYSAFVDAEKTDPAKAAFAKAELIKSVTEQAKNIRKKYINPPATTDFGVLFVPSEGMYSLLAAEDMSYLLQRDQRVLLAGPSTLAALLNSLQMGFRTLAVEKQSADIMRLLGAIKKSFERFSQALESTKKSMDAASNNLEKASTSSRGILQRLRTVEESADLYEAKDLLGDAYPGEENSGSDELE